MNSGDLSFMRSVWGETVVGRPLMLVLSSPSGAGKSSISRALIERHPSMMLSVSWTTRSPRPGEIDGTHYHFVSSDRFEANIAENGFWEHARVFDHRYGTPKAPAQKALAESRDVLFDIDWQGAQQLVQNAWADIVSVFILPPSLAELERRLHTRSQDSDEVIRGRMARAAVEMSHYAEYDYCIVNHVLEDSVRAVEAILEVERLKRYRQSGLAEFVKRLRGME